MAKPLDIHDVQENLDELTKRWRESNQRQRDSITRLLVGRQKALDILNWPDQRIHPGVKKDLIEALDAPVSDEIIAAVTEVMRRA
jgi:hypothetical protein